MGEKQTRSVERVEAIMADELAELEHLFVDGMVLTFIAAHPTNPSAHMVITGAENLGHVRATIDQTIHSRSQMNTPDTDNKCGGCRLWLDATRTEGDYRWRTCAGIGGTNRLHPCDRPDEYEPAEVLP